jgi:hypothetical protein
MTLSNIRSSTAIPYAEVSAGTSCPSGWGETSTNSFNGIGIVEDGQRWFQPTFNEFVVIPLDKGKSPELKPAPAALSDDEMGVALATIAAADAVGDLRRAFRSVFQALDRQMLEGQWAQLQKLLRTLLSKPYSTDVGVGALRFCSSARERIATWSDLINLARLRCEKDEADYKLVLRGLL